MHTKSQREMIRAAGGLNPSEWERLNYLLSRRRQQRDAVVNAIASIALLLIAIGWTVYRVQIPFTLGYAAVVVVCVVALLTGRRAC